MSQPDRPQLPSPPPTTLTTEQVADQLGVSPGTLWRAARDGAGIDLGDGVSVQPIRVGRVLRWPTAPILARLGILAGTTAEGSEPSDTSTSAT